MPNAASFFKTEIARLARKVVRADTEALRKAASHYRSEIATLKRRADAVEQQLRQAGRVRTPSCAPQSDDTPAGFRFSPKGLAPHRKRLGLSAEGMPSCSAHPALPSTSGRAAKRVYAPRTCPALPPSDHWAGAMSQRSWPR